MDEISLDATGAILDTKYYRANGMYDPQDAVGGHQPRGFDQNMVSYERFTVIGSKLKLTYMPDAAAGAVPGYFGAYVTDTNTPEFTAGTDLMESKKNLQKVRYAGHGVDGNKVAATSYFSFKKFFGTKKGLDNADYQGTSGSDPDDRAYFCLWAASIGGNNPDPVNFLLEIEYIAVLTVPIVIPQST